MRCSPRMDQQEVLDLFDRELRLGARPGGNGRRVESVDGVVRVIGPSAEPYQNTIVYGSGEAATADARIQRQIDDYGAIGHAFEWKVYGHDRPADMGERLIRHGLLPDPTETLVIMDVAAAAPRPPRSTLEIRRILDPARVADLIAVWDEVWSADHAWMEVQLGSDLRQQPDSISVYVAYDGEKPVAGAWSRFPAGSSFATLWGGSTLEAYRRRGVYSDLVAARIAEARQRGVRYATVEALPTSRPILERVGFLPFTTVTGYLWRPATPATPA